MKNWCSSILIGACCLIVACKDEPPPQKCFEVKATAYNSVPWQTRPGTSGNITAWGDVLVDSISSIAISRDLLDSGLTHGTLVYIKGFDTPFVVNDKMNKRHRKRIDIHMGKDVRAAREFGVKRVEMCFEVAEAELESKKMKD